MERMPPALNRVITVMHDKSYSVFDDGQGYNLNIVGVRTDDDRADTFNDWILVFYLYLDMWNYFAMPATTDPGTFYRENPLNLDGTAIMKPGQYRGAYILGRHKGYDALQQYGRITVWRDNNRDEVLDTDGTTEVAGVFGLNIHRGNKYEPSIEVDRWSAGCQVVQDPDQFDFLITLCRRARNRYGNRFTYTLLEERDFT